MLIPSDTIFKWLEDVRDDRQRLINRSALSGDGNKALLGSGGMAAIEDLRNRVQAYIDRETYASMKEAEREARKREKKLRSITAERRLA